MNQWKRSTFPFSARAFRQSSNSFGLELARESPAMRASGITRLMISAVRMLNAAMSVGLCCLLMSGSFHIAQSRTLPL
jgi:hypothetical protein